MLRAAAELAGRMRRRLEPCTPAKRAMAPGVWKLSDSTQISNSKTIFHSLFFIPTNNMSAEGTGAYPNQGDMQRVCGSALQPCATTQLSACIRSSFVPLLVAAGPGPIVKDGIVIESSNVEVFDTFDAMGLREELLVSTPR